MKEVQYNQIPTKYLVGHLKECCFLPRSLVPGLSLLAQDQPAEYYQCLFPLHIPLVPEGLRYHVL